MKTKHIIEGLVILEKYREGTDGWNVGAEHDTIYAYATDSPVSEDDVKRLLDMGWWQDDGANDVDGAGHYKPEESWICYA